MLNPLNHARTAGDVTRYRVEPYVVAADVYAHPMHVGRGGWTWYTGSAGWMYQAAIEALLGLRRRGTTFSVAPCIPATWPGYAIRWRVEAAVYHIDVTNPEHRCCGVGSATLDGVTVDPASIPLTSDGKEHHVAIVLGPSSGERGPAHDHEQHRKRA